MALLLITAQDILQKYADLVIKHHNLKSDHESEQDARRKFQSEKMHMQRQFNDLQRELVCCLRPTASSIF